MSKKITVLAGDGIGPEIMKSGLAILATVKPDYQIEEQFFGGAAIDHSGSPLPAETIEACQNADAILLGAIGGPKWDNANETPEKGLLALRKQLQLFANIRPIKVTDSLIDFSPIKSEIIRGTDFVIVRELTGGIYFGEPQELNAENALDTNTYQKFEIENILRQAFRLAQRRRKLVTSVDKANVLATSKLWRKTAEEIAKEFPDCTLEHQYVDSAAMKIIQQPTHFDVVVTENLFGDILSDEASVLPGSLGVLASASDSLNGPSLYEPIHGSAPDIAGQDIANPLSMILSVAMMLRQSFNENQLAEKIETACDNVLKKGIATKDLKGSATTTEFTNAVITELKGR